MQPNDRMIEQLIKHVALARIAPQRVRDDAHLVTELGLDCWTCCACTPGPSTSSRRVSTSDSPS